MIVYFFQRPLLSGHVATFDFKRPVLAVRWRRAFEQRRGGTRRDRHENGVCLLLVTAAPSALFLLLVGLLIGGVRLLHLDHGLTDWHLAAHLQSHHHEYSRDQCQRRNRTDQWVGRDGGAVGGAEQIAQTQFLLGSLLFERGYSRRREG